MTWNDRPDALELLMQSEIWVDGAGVTHRVEHMDLRHVDNVRAYLMRNGRTLAEAAWRDAISGMRPNGDQATAAFESVLDELTTACENPQPWLERTPLIEAFDRRLGRTNEELFAEAREIEVTVKLTVTESQGGDAVRRSLEEALGGLDCEYEIENFTERR